jgi:hypothetical protein
MKNNSFSLFVRTPTLGGRIYAFRLFCVATALVSLFSGLGLAQDVLPPATITGKGTAGFVPVFTGITTIGNSKIFQTVGLNVGIGITAPTARLDVNGTGNVRDTLTLFPKLTHPTLSVKGSAFAVSNTGKVTFVAGQTFPGTGTIKGVTAGTGLTGGGTSGIVTLGIATNACSSGSALSALPFTCSAFATLGSNTFDGEETITGGLSASGDIVGGRVFAGNSTHTGQAAIVNGDSGSQPLQVQNFATPANNVFMEAQFNATKATFFTDTLGDTTAIGTKSAAVPLQNGKMVKVFSLESPEVWFDDYGSAQLIGGVTTVTLDPTYAQTVNTSNGYRVFLTPTGDCKGLYVTQKTPGSFEVRELSGGQSNVEFDYRIVAHRKGYETMRLPVAKMPEPLLQNRP